MSELPLSAQFSGGFSLFRDEEYQNAYVTNGDGTTIWEKVDGSDSVLDSIGYTTELEGFVNNDFLASVGLDSLTDTPVNFNPPDESTSGQGEASLSNLREEYKTCLLYTSPSPRDS